MASALDGLEDEVHAYLRQCTGEAASALRSLGPAPDYLVLTKNLFVFLRIRHEYEAAITPAAVDKIWHTLLLNTRLYARVCQALVGDFVHHSPSASWADCNRSLRILTTAAMAHGHCQSPGAPGFDAALWLPPGDPSAYQLVNVTAVDAVTGAAQSAGMFVHARCSLFEAIDGLGELMQHLQPGISRFNTVLQSSPQVSGHVPFLSVHAVPPVQPAQPGGAADPEPAAVFRVFPRPAERPAKAARRLLRIKLRAEWLEPVACAAAAAALEQHGYMAELRAGKGIDVAFSSASDVASVLRDSVECFRSASSVVERLRHALQRPGEADAPLLPPVALARQGLVGDGSGSAPYKYAPVVPRATVQVHAPALGDSSSSGAQLSVSIPVFATVGELRAAVEKACAEAAPAVAARQERALVSLTVPLAGRAASDAVELLGAPELAGVRLEEVWPAFRVLCVGAGAAPPPLVARVVTGSRAKVQEALADAASDDGFVVTLAMLTGRSSQVRMRSSEPVLVMKLRIHAKEGIPPDQVRVIHRSAVMADHLSAAACGLVKDSVVHMILCLRGC